MNINKRAVLFPLIFTALRLLSQNQGAPDPTFANKGIIRQGEGGVYGICLRDDGKILTAGSTILSSPLIVRRFLQNGMPDPAFGTNGRADVMIDSVRGTQPVAILSKPAGDGSVFIVGNTMGSVADQSIWIVRIQANGKPDLSFGTGGIRMLPVAGQAKAAVLAANDKILIAGHLNRSSTDPKITDALLIRLNTQDGSLDQSFYGGGIVSATFPNYASFSGVAVVSNGSILATGGESGIWTPSGYQSWTMIAKFDKNGVPDPAFGQSGSIRIENVNFPSISSAVLPDGKLISLGFNRDVSGKYCLMRFMENGSLDTAFNGSGIAIFEHPDVLAPTTLEAGADGKILVGGHANKPGASPDLLVARHLPNGTYDAAFGTGGIVTLHTGDSSDIRDGYDYVTDLALQQDGKILAGGVFWNISIPWPQGRQRMALVRLNATFSPAALSETRVSLLNVFPNPARDRVHIDIEQVAVQPDAPCLLFDWSGILVRRQALTGTGISVDGLPDGLYLLKIATPTCVYQARLIVSH